jgi:hypothetical protein
MGQRRASAALPGFPIHAFGGDAGPSYTASNACPSLAFAGTQSYDRWVSPGPTALRGPSSALRWVLEAGMAAEVEVTGGSMEPTLPRGSRVKVSSVDAQTELQVGDVVVIVSGEPGDLIVHRLMHAFVDDGASVVVHQGDARGAAFGVVPRESVIALVSGVAGTAVEGEGRLRPLDPRRFAARRAACRAYALAWRVATAAGLRRSPIVRRWSERLRGWAGHLTG